MLNAPSASAEQLAQAYKHRVSNLMLRSARLSYGFARCSFPCTEPLRRMFKLEKSPSPWRLLLSSQQKVYIRSHIRTYNFYSSTLSLRVLFQSLQLLPSSPLPPLSPLLHTAMRSFLAGLLLTPIVLVAAAPVSASNSHSSMLLLTCFASV